VTFIALAAILTAAAGLIYHNGTFSAGFRRLIAGQAFCVLLSSLMGIGLVTLLAFVTEFKTQSAVLLQLIVAVLLAAAAFGGIWVLGRWTAQSRSDSSPSDSLHHHHPA